MEKTINIKAQDIENYFREKNNGILSQEDGILCGDPNKEVKRILITWMADKDAICYAGENNIDCIIAHEGLFMPYYKRDKDARPDYISWQGNQVRKNLLSKYDITMMRMHGTLHSIHDFYRFIPGLLDLGKEIEGEDGNKQSNAFDIEPVTYKDLIERIKNAFSFPYVRATPGDPDRIVKRVGIIGGGGALFVNVFSIERQARNQCDTLIVGETDNYAIRYAVDSGMDLIETSHEVIENPALKEYIEIFKKDFPECHVEFYGNPCAFEML